MPGQTLGARIAKYLKEQGVDTIFGIPGVHNIELYRGIEAAGITHILARHEQGAGFMADGYARATGKPGFAFVISGPGLTNIMTPMGQAYSDSVPMLVISTCLPEAAAMPGKLHQMRDQTAAGAAVCDWSLRADDEDLAVNLLDCAFAEFANGRGRPKHISIPVDILSRRGPPLAVKSAVSNAVLPNADAVAALARAIDAAQKPLFIFGGGATHASAAALAIVKKSGAAVFTSYAGRGVIGAAWPLHYGATLARPDSARVLAQADLVVAVGTELAEVDLWRAELGHKGALARIDTDDTVLADFHDADLTIKADAQLALAALERLIVPTKPKWDAAAVADRKAAFRAETDSQRPGVVPYVDALHRALPADALIYSDMTQFAYVAKEIYPMPAPDLWHHPFGFGTLGYALPAAIGAKIARPDRTVVAIAGDYGFQYTLQELGVAAELSLSLPVILWDNGKLQEIEDSMVKAQIAPNAVVAKNPDFELLAAAYGIGYLAATTPADFQIAMQVAQNADRPTLVHVRPD